MEVILLLLAWCLAPTSYTRPSPPYIMPFSYVSPLGLSVVFVSKSKVIASMPIHWYNVANNIPSAAELEIVHLPRPTYCQSRPRNSGVEVEILYTVTLYIIIMSLYHCITLYDCIYIYNKCVYVYTYIYIQCTISCTLCKCACAWYNSVPRDFFQSSLISGVHCRSPCLVASQDQEKLRESRSKTLDSHPCPYSHSFKLITNN